MDCHWLFFVPQGSSGMDCPVHHFAADRCDAGAYPYGRTIHIYFAIAGIFSGADDRMQKPGGRRETRISHLFAGFRSTTAPLITIGGIYLVGQVLILGVFMLVGGDVLMGLLLEGKRVDENELKSVSGDMLSASLVALMLSIPLMMAAWFAPLLVIFNDMPALDAMRLSFVACLKNIIAFQIYGITLVVLTVMLATMPLWPCGIVHILRADSVCLHLCKLQGHFRGYGSRIKSPDNSERLNLSRFMQEPVLHIPAITTLCQRGQI